MALPSPSPAPATDWIELGWLPPQSAPFQCFPREDGLAHLLLPLPPAVCCPLRPALALALAQQALSAEVASWLRLGSLYSSGPSLSFRGWVLPHSIPCHQVPSMSLPVSPLERGEFRVGRAVGVGAVSVPGTQSRVQYRMDTRMSGQWKGPQAGF